LTRSFAAELRVGPGRALQARADAYLTRFWIVPEFKDGSGSFN
jgi:hypothetical protein